MIYLSKSEFGNHKVDNANTQNPINTYFKEETFNTDKILALGQKVEFLDEQVESLKQELQYKERVLEQYQQEIMCTNSEMSIVNNDLQDVLSLKNLEVDKAIQLAQSILSNNKSTRESLADLLSAIYDVLVTADQLE